MPPSLIIRPATTDDAIIIGDIYNHYIRNTHVTFMTEARTEEYWTDWINRFETTGPYRIYVVERNEVDGFALSSRFNEREAYSRTVETSIYLRPVATGQGLGARLYETLFEDLAAEDVHRAMAGIALPNDASIALHKRFGFRDIGTMTEVGFKFGRYIDVLRMEKAL